MAAPGLPPTTPQDALRPAPEPVEIVVAVAATITSADVAGLCRRVRTLVEGRAAETVVFDVGALLDPDLGTVDALARLQLTARRLGSRIRLRNAGVELRDLLALVGLSDVLYLPVWSGNQSGGKAEQREQSLGVEERVERGDPAS